MQRFLVLFQPPKPKRLANFKLRSCKSHLRHLRQVGSVCPTQEQGVPITQIRVGMPSIVVTSWFRYRLIKILFSRPRADQVDCGAVHDSEGAIDESIKEDRDPALIYALLVRVMDRRMKEDEQKVFQ